MFVCEELPKIPGMMMNEDGIFGIGPPFKGNLVDRWFQADKRRKRIISVCFSSTGGYLEFGKKP